MNFPHKSLPKSGAELEGPARRDLKILIARAVERQSMTPTSRAWSVRGTSKSASPAGQQDATSQRIDLFSGMNRRGYAADQTETPVSEGSFQPNYEHAVYLGDSGD